MKSLFTILLLGVFISSEAQNISQSQVRQFNAVPAYRVFGRGAGVGTPSFITLDSNHVPQLHSQGYYDVRYSNGGYSTVTLLTDTSFTLNRGNGTKDTITISGNGAGSSGSATSIATNNATGITGGIITSIGTLSIDTGLIRTVASAAKVRDSLGTIINSKLSATIGAQGNILFRGATGVSSSSSFTFDSVNKTVSVANTAAGGSVISGFGFSNDVPVYGTIGVGSTTYTAPAIRNRAFLSFDKGISLLSNRGLAGGGTDDIRMYPTNSVMPAATFRATGHTTFGDTTEQGGNNIVQVYGSLYVRDTVRAGVIMSGGAVVSGGGGTGTTYTFGTGITNNAGTVTANLATGVSGGQSAIGGTAASNNLTLSSTSSGTKGKIIFGTSAYDEVNNRLGIGTTSPLQAIHIKSTSNLVYDKFETSATTAAYLARNYVTGIYNGSTTRNNASFEMGLYQAGTSSTSADGFYIGRSGLNQNDFILNRDGNAGIGLTPSASLTIRAGTAAAGTAPIKLTTSGAAILTTPEAGAFETDGTDLYWTNSAGVRKKVTLQ